MSTYIRMTKSPRTGEFTPAMWQDDYFGHRQYGVKFLGEDYYYRPDDLETNDDPVPSEAVNELYGYEKKTKQPMNKSDCCNAEVIGAVARGWCSDKNKHKEMDTDLAEAIVKEVELLFSSKSKVTKYYLVKLKTASEFVSALVTATSPQEAYEKVVKPDTVRIVDIKLIEIIQEDTNQD